MLVIPQIYCGMKTAISLPDELFEEADAVAMQIGVSRSQLYATALEEYVAKFRSEQITSQLNAVYSVQAPTDKAVTSAARKTLRRAEW
jgi:metal-responsive CopG/Arc/MetJ family transcriptional regulator